ncbi:MAG TPA: hypothetical protein VM694_15730, partial [Polyangium sp.]|nr:hypothetical protein [Polyangium sp.]
MGKKQKRKHKETKETLAAAEPKETLATAAFVAADAGIAVPEEKLSRRKGASPAEDEIAEPPPASSEDEDEEDEDDEDDDDWSAAEIAPALPYDTDLDADTPSAPRLVPGYDLDADEAQDVAPIGPTEAVIRPSMPPASMRAEADGTGASATNPAEIEQQIRDLEARLDLMIGRGRERADEPTYVPKPPPVPATRKSDVPKAKPRSDVPAPRASVPESATANEVLSPEFYAKQWGRAGLRSRSEEVDEFGLDPAFEAKLLPVLDFMTKRYFRVEVGAVGQGRRDLGRGPVVVVVVVVVVLRGRGRRLCDLVFRRRRAFAAGELLGDGDTGVSGDERCGRERLLRLRGRVCFLRLLVLALLLLPHGN